MELTSYMHTIESKWFYSIPGEDILMIISKFLMGTITKKLY